MRRRALCWNALWNRDGSCGILGRRSKGNGLRGHVFVKRERVASRSHSTESAIVAVQHSTKKAINSMYLLKYVGIQ